MLYYEECKDRKGNSAKVYYLTQGDTFQNRLTIKSSNGDVIDRSLIKQVLFKLSNKDFKWVYTQEYEYNDELGRWIITIPSEMTAKWPIATCIYEYQITYISDVVRTPRQTKFCVMPQIQGGDKNVT